MIYKMTKKEIIVNLGIILLAIIIIAILFYGTIKVALLLLPLAVPIFRQRKRKIIERKKEKLEIQFKDMLISVSDSLKTGYSMHNALIESYKDLMSVYGYDSYICIELRLMISKIKLNTGEEEVFKEFAKRTGLRNAILFSRIFSVAKRTGGNMTNVIRSVTDDIVLKENVKEEIAVSVTEKRLEQKLMTVIPVFLIIYIKIMSPGFLDVMYKTIAGRIVMTVCVTLYLAAYMWAQKIIQIDSEY
jgi:tight adherence protein B